MKGSVVELDRVKDLMTLTLKLMATPKRKNATRQLTPNAKDSFSLNVSRWKLPKIDFVETLSARSNIWTWHRPDNWKLDKSDWDILYDLSCPTWGLYNVNADEDRHETSKRDQEISEFWLLGVSRKAARNVRRTRHGNRLPKSPCSNG